MFLNWEILVEKRDGVVQAPTSGKLDGVVKLVPGGRMGGIGCITSMRESAMESVIKLVRAVKLEGSEEKVTPDMKRLVSPFRYETEGGSPTSGLLDKSMLMIEA